MPTVNEALLDAAIEHQVDLARYSNHVVRRIIAILNRADVRLFAELTAALDRLPPESFTVERLEAMLGAVRGLNAQAYAQVQQELRQELRDFTDYEVAFQQQTLSKVLPQQVRGLMANVTAEQVYAAALARPFQGSLLKGFLDDLEAGKAKRIRQAVAQGYTEGRTVPQIVRELRGTRAKGFSDGIIEIDRRNAEAVVRTALGHMAGFTRDRFHEANEDLIKALSWTSTLDGRTTPICQARDGKQYTPKTHKPIGHELPWLGGPGRAHWGCRSTSVPVIKSWRELGIDAREFNPTTRASMDGQVPAGLTYAKWLKKQPAAKQDEILGPARAKLFRSGDLALDKFQNDKGQTVSLADLRKQLPAGGAAPHPKALPNWEKAVISDAKLAGYALNMEHPEGGSKARVFERALGIMSKDAAALAQQVREQLALHPAVPHSVNQYGSRFNVDMPVQGPKGSRIVRTAWILRPDADAPELITIFVK